MTDLDLSARFTMLQGECLGVMMTLPDAVAAAVITDPPYSSGGFTRGDRIKFIDEGYGYADAAPLECPEPWPINPFYDKKALWWLIRNVRDVPGPIVFWSIGD